MKVTDFGGMIPRRSRTLLPDNAAEHAANCFLLSGALRGLHQLYPVVDLNRSPTYEPSAPAQIAFPVGSYSGDYDWKGFASRDVHFIKGAVTNDAYNRYYWTGDGPPKYNTEARLRAGDSDFLLGVPAPTSELSLTPDTSDPQASRAYTYTFVSPYGEEGPPVAPVVATGGEGDWVLSGFDTAIPDAAQRAPGGWTIRIYRTVSGKEATAYYFVDDIPLGTTTYTDSVPSDEVVLNTLLESADWEPPPDDLDGLVAHPGGFMVGFVGNDVFMSVPYRPHAWPQEFVLTTDYPVVALGIYGNAVVVATTANPYVLSGDTPLSMSFTKVEAAAPCLSRYGLVSYEFGVVYPSDVGLILATSDGVRNLTEPLVTSTDWKLRYRPAELYTSVRYGTQYIAYFEANKGFIFNPAERNAWSELTAFSGVDSLFLNPLTGRAHVLRKGILWEWDSAAMPPVEFRWRSKVFDMTKPINLGAARITFSDYREESGAAGDSRYDDLREEFNTWRFQYPLAPIGAKMFGSVNVIDPAVFAPNGTPIGSLVPQHHDPAAGSALLRAASDILLGQDIARFKVWADDVLVLDTLVHGEELVMLPAGFRAQRWQFELASFTRVLHFAVATSPTALEQA